MIVNSPVADAGSAGCRSDLLKAVAVSISLASLLLVDVWKMVEQSRTADTRYFAIVPPTPVLEITGLVDTAIIAALFFLLMRAMARSRPWLSARVSRAILAFAGGYGFWRLWVFVTDSARPILEGSVSVGPQLMGRSAAEIAVMALQLLALQALLFGTVQAPARTWAAVNAVALILFPFAAWRIGQTGWQLIHRPRIGVELKAPRVSSARRQPKPLVLWLIFDEMDYDAAFGEAADPSRVPNLNLLRQSVFQVERMVESAPDTIAAIPSYTIGHVVTGVRWDGPDDLMLKLNGRNECVAWTSQRTLFDEAADAGRRTAIIGYLHPYCHLFGDRAAKCEALPHLGPGDFMKWWRTLQDEPMYRACLLQAGRILPVPGSVRRFDGAWFKWWEPAVLGQEERVTAENISRMRASLLDILADRSLDFVFAHLPLPHPPNLYAFPGSNVPIRNPGYAGNLQAADHLFGEIRQALAASGRWDETAVVVTSDHSVRSFWKETLLLSPSLLRAIEDREEPTIPLFVKLPHQSRPLTYSEPFNSVLIHGIIQALLHGGMEQPEAVAEYISTHRREHPLPASSMRAAN